MAIRKWAEYSITSVTYEDNDGSKISHVRLHKGDPNSNVGKKFFTSQVVELLGIGSTISTAMWDYKTQKWVPGEKVEVVYERIPGKFYGPKPKLLVNPHTVISWSIS